jgi:hypothetical protein
MEDHMLDVTTNNTIAVDPWIARVTECILRIWGEQAFFRPEDRARGVTALVRRRCDFDTRVHAVANLIEVVAPCLAKSGALTDAEYNSVLLAPVHAQLPFLNASVRAVLTRNLIALHAMKP